MLYSTRPVCIPTTNIYSAFGFGTKRVRSKLTHFCGLGRTRSLFDLSDELNSISCLIQG
jgi:hypothetical protein